MFNESEFWNINDIFKGGSLEDIKEIQRELSLPYAVAVLNLNGDLNTGIIIRTAVIMGAKEVFIFGKRKYDKRSTVGGHNYITINRIFALSENGDIDYNIVITELQRYGYTPVFVEQGGTNFRSFIWPENPCIIFGNESVGIPQELINKYDTVSINQRGVLRSLNVSTAAGIVMEHLSYSLS